MIRWFEHRQVYAPSATLEFTPEHPYEDVSFKAKDGVKLHGWFFPGSTRAHLTFLVFHGNGGNICHRLTFYDAWLDLGVSLFTIGRWERKEFQINKSARRNLDKLLARRKE